MNKRSTKFYRKNEAEVMKRLGFSPTINSGAGWIQKEDAESEHFICQLKSTDKESMSIKQHDLNVLEIHASESHKLPVFAFQFLNHDEVWVAVRESDIEEIKAVIRGEREEQKTQESIDETEEIEYNYNVPRSSEDAIRSAVARKKYMEQREKEMQKRREEAREEMKQRRRKRNKSWQRS